MLYSIAMSIESYEILGELFPGADGLHRRYDLLNASRTDGMTVLASPETDSTLLTCGTIYSGSELRMGDDGAIDEKGVKRHSPRQLREDGAPVAFYGHNPAGEIAVHVRPPLTDPESRRRAVCAFASYAIALTQATTALERACPPFGVTRRST